MDIWWISILVKRNVRNLGKIQRMWVEMYWPTLSRQYLSMWKTSGQQTAKASLTFALHIDRVTFMWLTGLCWIADSLAAVRPKRLKIQLTDFFPLSLRREKVRDVLCFETMSKNDRIITLTYLSRTKYKSKAPWHDLSSSTSSSAPADGSVNNKSPKKSAQKHIFTTERAIVS